ncbi:MULTISPECIES: mechanosensitive ion channel family protein [Clostridium]|uniref:mechanosensitive ion channel family protein n=1 Tax=Clostridium TaxID=1485 RepID=UPI001CCFDF04|nr:MULTISPECIES: mechanosensitive ion channel family protein [Clostridium]MBZ9621375.1 mechanosensitive ion channel family protein [Clostridium sp. FP2]MBZ9632793.1 mechanosensitive ion channel family protein [Clostridium sp. FP1]
MFQSIVDFFVENRIQYVFTDMQSYKFEYVGIAIVVFALFVLLKKVFAKYVFKIILRLVNKTKFNTDTKIVAAFQKPVTNFFEVLGFYFAFKILTLAGISISLITIDKFFSSAVIILITWGIYNFTGESSVLFERMHRAYDIKVDKILFPFMSKALRLIWVALAITIIAEKWGYNIQGFVAGLGLGGLAFALAAKDAAANIIAGIFIILDKPFTIGDWISSDSLEGSIEDISFRTTKIRAVDQSLIIVPNSKLTNDAVINFSRRGKRRVSFNLGLNYRTSRDKLETCVESIRHMLENHSQINKEDILVRFDKFNSSSIDVLICFFTDTADFNEYFKIKEDVNFEIMDILKKQGVSMAFPSTSLYVESLPNTIEENFKLVDKAQKKETSE